MNQIKVALFFVPFLFIGCATTLMTKGTHSNVIIDIPDKLLNKTITIRSFSWIDSFYGKNHEASLTKNTELEIYLKDILKQNSDFQKVSVITLTKELKIKKKNREDIKEELLFLQKGLSISESDYFLDIYEYRYEGIYHPYFEFAMGILHFGTLGLVPYIGMEKVKYFARLYGKGGKEFAPIEVNNSALKWMWSPNYFRGGKLYGDESFKRNVDRNAIKYVLNKAFQLFGKRN